MTTSIAIDVTFTMLLAYGMLNFSVIDLPYQKLSGWHT